MLSRSFWHYMGWLGILVLIVTGCASRDMPTITPTLNNPAEPTSQAQLPTVSNVVSNTATPTQQPPTETATAVATSTSPPPLPTATPTTTPSPSPTASPTPTPTPVLRRLTTGGCCTQPFWSPDSTQVLFIDRPALDAPLGIWSASLARPEATPELFTERIAFYSADLKYAFEYAAGATVVERLADPRANAESDRWTVPANGRPISISPNQTRIAWQVSNGNLPFERRTTQVWVANLDGTEAQLVATLPRGSFSGWVSDDVLLLSSRESLESRETILYTLSLMDESTMELVRAERPRGERLSPDGQWLAYFIALSDEPTENGTWLVRTDGTQRLQLDRELFGAYQWRDAHRLVIIPFQPEAVYHQLWELDVETGEARRLTDPSITPFKIANGDWQMSPDGQHVAFVENSDRNIWVLSLTD